MKTILRSLALAAVCGLGVTSCVYDDYGYGYGGVAPVGGYYASGYPSYYSPGFSSLSVGYYGGGYPYYGRSYPYYGGYSGYRYASYPYRYSRYGRHHGHHHHHRGSTSLSRVLNTRSGAIRSDISRRAGATNFRSGSFSRPSSGSWSRGSTRVSAPRSTSVRSATRVSAPSRGSAADRARMIRGR